MLMASAVRVARLMGHVSEFLRPKDAVAKQPQNFCPDLEESSYVVMRGRLREDRQMLLYVQTWLPLLTITLTAAIFFGVASFILVHAKA